jgi:DNA (cytosine-5)-methyltransferase 1
VNADGLVLSLFPGIGLLDMAFEEEGYCVVRGPDVLWGGDIHRFSPPAGVFRLVIGGPPCQDFTPLAGINRALGRQPKYGNLIPEFARVVGEAQPDAWLLENVERAPAAVICGYRTSEVVLDNRWLGAEQARRRRFTFGSRDGSRLVINDVVALENPVYESAVTSTTGYLLGNGNGYWKRPAAAERQREASRRPVSRLAELQGLSPDFLGDAPFTDMGKRRVIANGVPLPMGRAIARAVSRAMQRDEAAS